MKWVKVAAGVYQAEGTDYRVESVRADGPWIIRSRGRKGKTQYRTMKEAKAVVEAVLPRQTEPASEPAPTAKILPTIKGEPAIDAKPLSLDTINGVKVKLLTPEPGGWYDADGMVDGGHAGSPHEAEAYDMDGAEDEQRSAQEARVQAILNLPVPEPAPRPSTVYRVKFSRIGRHYDVKPLDINIAGVPRNAVKRHLENEVRAYALQHLATRHGCQTTVDMASGVVLIEYGRFGTGKMSVV